MRQDSLKGLATLTVKGDLARKLVFSLIINAFSEKEARKAFAK
jgi:hypothetical protein